MRCKKSPTPLASRTGSSCVAPRCPSPRYFHNASVAMGGAMPTTNGNTLRQLVTSKSSAGPNR
jgi:hypothetical protein